MRVWVIYYSQTGDSAAVAREFAEPFRAAGHDVLIEPIRLAADYPYPWRSPLRFFSVLPECLLGPPPEIEPLTASADFVADLIILVYQAWFLSPSLPVQGLLASLSAERLRDHSVITVTVSRQMWLSASERMKRLLQHVGARHRDNVSVVHQGAPWATFVTAPRSLLFGQREPFWIFPAAGLSAAALDRVRRLGVTACERWSQRRIEDGRPLLTGAGAVDVNQRYLIPECLGWYLFMAWAYLLKGMGRFGRIPRALGTLGFIGFLVSAVVVGIPLVWLVSTLAWPILRSRVRAYAEVLAAPSGGIAVASE